MELRRRRGQIDDVDLRQVHPGRVAGEGDLSGTVVAQAIGVVVIGMAGRVQGSEGQSAGADHVTVIERCHPLGRRGQEVAPQRVHLVAIDARGAGQQLAGVDQVRCADVVDVELCPLLRPPAGRPGMVEVRCV